MTLQVNINPDPAAIGPDLPMLGSGIALGHPDDSVQLTRHIVVHLGCKIPPGAAGNSDTTRARL
ncbi:MAG: hypothetical protein KGJ54_10355 [Betaproteobacteria bacterium]|nr:hypothetical protein [Betaproteobacteria bacterium]MDE2175672.1 hypothetical protein [Betaproteobacteria bacterium]MDE2270098.1 hypothetical protein [Betaproteobacteria bacterium]CQR42951.1 hypothetical protein THICB3310108 [Thiomonas sp. CB3]